MHCAKFKLYHDDCPIVNRCVKFKTNVISYPGHEYRNKMTALSLVNKLNLDVDVQMADSLAIMADMVYMIKIGGKGKSTKVHSMMKRLINRKVNSKDNPGIFEILV